MSDLKPCPFCGGVAFYRGWSTGDKPSKAIGWIQCEACMAKGPSVQDDDDAKPAAAGAWNLRQGDAMTPREQQLERALTALVERWEQFTSHDGWGNQEDAYYDLAKHAQKEWREAIAALSTPAAPLGEPAQDVRPYRQGGTGTDNYGTPSAAPSGEYARAIEDAAEVAAHFPAGDMAGEYLADAIAAAIRALSPAPRKDTSGAPCPPGEWERL